MSILNAWQQEHLKEWLKNLTEEEKHKPVTVDIGNIFITVELKEGIFFKLIKYQPITFICRHIPYKWVKWLISKSLQYRVGKSDTWHKLDLKNIMD